MEKTADSLLLVRPDYTIYDEVRKTNDFEVFSDMRMAGVGMVGVVHASRAIDALQRLVGRVELGMIPQIVDTVVYIEAGEVHTVYDVTTEVKVPAGLTAEDLARPVIQVSNFETGRPEYEIYTFNRQVVTVPLNDEDGEGEAETGVGRIAKQEIEREIRSVAHGHVDVELKGNNKAIVYVSEGTSAPSSVRAAAASATSRTALGSRSTSALTTRSPAAARAVRAATARRERTGRRSGRAGRRGARHRCDPRDHLSTRRHRRRRRRRGDGRGARGRRVPLHRHRRARRRGAGLPRLRNRRRVGGRNRPEADRNGRSGSLIAGPTR